jgi:hypothetical protein
MPTSPASGVRAQPGSTTANRRILRLALGTALSLWISQAVGWNLSYVAPVITMSLLAMPLVRPQPKFFLVVVVALIGSVYGAFLFLPMLLHQELVGLLLVGLALFHGFYFTARGGTPAVGTLITIALALTVAVGTVSVDALLAVGHGLAAGVVAGVVVAMLSHAIIADPPQESPAAKAATPAAPALAAARAHAMRSLALVAPILLWFLLSGSSAGNMAVLIKVAAMGQEVSAGGTRSAARSLIVSTLVGGVAALIGWQLLSIWPSLILYTLSIGCAGLIFGRRIFAGEGLRGDGATWSYAYLTMIVVLAPAVLDGDYGSSADARFYDRLIMFGWATLYGVAAVYVFDAFWPRGESRRSTAADDRSEAAS